MCMGVDGYAVICYIGFELYNIIDWFMLYELWGWSGWGERWGSMVGCGWLGWKYDDLGGVGWGYRWDNNDGCIELS